MAREEYPEWNEVTTKRRLEVADQYSKDLEKQRPAYLQAREATEGRTDRDQVVELARLLKSYHAGDPGEKAIYVVAQAAMLVHELVMPFAVVTNYEAKEKEVEKLRK
jgi:hypothetical protein